ncbi:MAG: hypothetical protein Q7K57_57090 [Burkholderiaceae bacterium]|nr:hypothetical protein [Burkholderiaceae bacterium]
MIASTMKPLRIILFPLLLFFALLFAQQAGAAHAIHHALEDLTQQQEDKYAPHSATCEKCADYVQLGSALNVGVIGFTPPHVSSEIIQHRTNAFRSIRILAATARAPPYSI